MLKKTLSTFILVGFCVSTLIVGMEKKKFKKEVVNFGIIPIEVIYSEVFKFLDEKTVFLGFALSSKKFQKYSNLYLYNVEDDRPITIYFSDKSANCILGSGKNDGLLRKKIKHPLSIKSSTLSNKTFIRLIFALANKGNKIQKMCFARIPSFNDENKEIIRLKSGDILKSAEKLSFNIFYPRSIETVNLFISMLTKPITLKLDLKNDFNELYEYFDFKPTKNVSHLKLNGYYGNERVLSKAIKNMEIKHLSAELSYDDWSMVNWEVIPESQLEVLETLKITIESTDKRQIDGLHLSLSKFKKLKKLVIIITTYELEEDSDLTKLKSLLKGVKHEKLEEIVIYCPEKIGSVFDLNKNDIKSIFMDLPKLKEIVLVFIDSETMWRCKRSDYHFVAVREGEEERVELCRIS